MIHDQQKVIQLGNSSITPAKMLYHKTIMKPVFVFFNLWLLLVGVSLAQDAPEVFLLDEGAYGTLVQGGLAPGEIRTYYVSAQKGQQLRASLVSGKDNAFLTLADSHGVSLLSSLPKGTKVRNLDLILPKTGKYRLQISSFKGPSSYVLEVTLDDPPHHETTPSSSEKDDD